MLREIHISNSGSPVEILQLSELLLELSAKLIRVNTGDLDNEIKKALRIIINYLNFDWVTFCEFSGADRIFNRVYSYFVPFVNSPSISTIRKDTAFLTEKVRCGKTVFLQQLPKDLPKNAKWDRTFCVNNGVKTSLALPLKIDNNVLGGLYFASLRRENVISEKLICELHYFAEILASQINRKIPAPKIERNFIDLDKINIPENDFCDIIGSSPSFKQILKNVKQVADTNVTVLLLGETGTGKGVIAKAIHNTSICKNRQMIQINCASLSPSIIESELFGHEKGAFTGAHIRRTGCFERAHGSTLFLDEIGELPIELQAKLLRVLQDGVFERVGGNETIKCDVRVIAASNRDLEKEIESGKFRRDLYYRLNIFPVYIPPLRERMDDIPLFINFFIEKYSKISGKYFNAIAQKDIEALQSYSWPGNIRELENLIARSVITSPEGNLIINLSASPGTAVAGKTSLVDFERAFILKTLENTIWRINGPKGAARQLGLNPSTLRLRMKKLNIQRPSPQNS
jgi:formate hydrogenlyase transcriptional activator